MAILNVQKNNIYIYIFISKYYISINEIKDISKYIQLIYYIYLHIFEFERLD